MRLAPIVAAVLLAAGARAQTAGGISGVVVDEDGAPVARAVLIVSGPALQGERTASTDSSGPVASNGAKPGTGIDDAPTAFTDNPNKRARLTSR